MKTSYETVISPHDRGHQIIKDIAKCLIRYEKKHIKDTKIERTNNPQRCSTCFGFYCLLLLLPAALVSSYIALMGITTGRTKCVI